MTTEVEAITTSETPDTRVTEETRRIFEAVGDPVVEPPKRERRTRTTRVPTAESNLAQWSDEDFATIGLAIAILFMVATRTIGNITRSPLAMEAEEANGIAKPLTRIGLRRLKIRGAKKGDLVDSIALATAMFSYCARVTEIAFGHRGEVTRINNEPVNRISQQHNANQSGNGVVLGPDFFTGGRKPGEAQPTS